MIFTDAIAEGGRERGETVLIKDFDLDTRWETEGLVEAVGSSDGGARIVGACGAAILTLSEEEVTVLERSWEKREMTYPIQYYIK